MTPEQLYAIGDTLVASLLVFLFLVIVLFLSKRPSIPACPICGNKNYRVEYVEATHFDENKHALVFSCGYEVNELDQPTSLCDSDLHTRTQRNMIREASSK